MTAALVEAGVTRDASVLLTDERRLGRRGQVRRVLAPRGVKVTQRLQLKYEWRYLFAAVDGQAGRVWWAWVPSMKAEALWPTIAGLQAMAVLDGLVWDNAPSHHDADIADLDLAFVGLPPYSPELNPVENLWHYLRSHHLSNRAYADYDHLLDAGGEAWRSLTPEVIKSVCRCPYLERAE